MRASLFVLLLSLGLASCESRPGREPGAPAADAKLTWEPSRWLDRTRVVQLADDTVLLRERERLLATDTRGRLLWQRDVDREVTRITPLAGGTIAIAGQAPQLEIVDAASGRTLATHPLPRSPGAVIALGHPAAAAVHVGTGYAFVRDAKLTVAERASRIDIIPDAGVTDPRGNLWVVDRDHRSWAALDPSGERAFEFMPEGFDASFSFPLAFTADAAWIFQWRDGAVANLVAIDYACVIPNRTRPAGSGIPPACILSETPIPEIQRAPLVTARDNIVVLSHGSVMTDDGSRLIDRRIDAYKDGTLLWTRAISGLGPPLPLEICGSRVAVLGNDALYDSAIHVFDLLTGTPVRPGGDRVALALLCHGDSFVLVGGSSISTLPATP